MTVVDAAPAPLPGPPLRPEVRAPLAAIDGVRTSAPAGSLADCAALLRAGEAFTLSELPDGGFLTGGTLRPETGQLLQAAPDAEVHGNRADGDIRSAAQRREAALAQLADTPCSARRGRHRARPPRRCSSR